MHDNDILILKGHQVLSLLTGRELELIEAVRMAYVTHAAGDSSLPQSTFLNFAGQPKDRIIALPAYLGEGFGVAGIKWIASFPDNLKKGMDRASAVIILNSPLTGRPEAFIEGSIISAKRTAASAALAGRTLHEGRSVATVGLLGCGVINYEIARFILAACPGVERLIVSDTDESRAIGFKDKCRRLSQGITVEVAKDFHAVLREAKLVSVATTAIQPHLTDLSECQPGSTILHISLRDLSPEVILSSDNIVDDVDHVCRAQTSVHLAEQLTGNRDFIRCTLADVLTGKAPQRRDAESVAVFSPFGLGVLDLAVAKLARELGHEQNPETVITSFLPTAWEMRD
jgi:N-[(2S)-2-amino-2-carboxyethyl]-L-glutamate dehydrogenase